jgi:hypothetical protein
MPKETNRPDKRERFDVSTVRLEHLLTQMTCGLSTALLDPVRNPMGTVMSAHA